MTLQSVHRDMVAALSRTAMTAVMVAALALIFVSSAMLVWVAAGVLCLFLALNLRQFTFGTWVPVVLSVVVLGLALRRGLPTEVYLQACGRMVFLAALMAAVNTLRTAADLAPEVALAGRYLTRQPASRRYLALTTGGHLFGVLINFGGLALLLDLSSRAMKEQAPDGLSPEMQDVRLRRMTLAVMRGFGLITLWSPLGFATNLILITLPGISYVQFGPIGFAMSLVFAGIGWTMDRMSGRRYRQMALPQAVAPPGAWVGAAMLAGHVVMLGGSVIALHEVSRLSFQQALLVLVPIYALLWTVLGTRGGVGDSLVRLRTAVRQTWLRQSRAAGEVGIFASAGFLPVALLALMPMDRVQEFVVGLGLGALPLALSIMVLIILGTLLGVNPIVTTAVLGAVAAELGIPGLSQTIIALAIIGGWSVSVGLSPFMTTVLLCATSIDRPAWRVGPIWNGPYCAVILAVWVVFLVVTMLTGLI